MKKRIGRVALLIALLFAALVAVPVMASAENGEGNAEFDEQIRKADELFLDGGLDNYKEAMEIYKDVISRDPENYEAHWKGARSIREYGEEHLRLGKPDYEEACREYGRKGMEYAEKAMALNPDHPGGYLYYGINVGTYSEGVGIVTALREGLKDKTQENFETAYEMDPHFEMGAPILSLGRFWQVVPWPYRDTDKAEELFREYQETEYWDEVIEGRIYLAELLKGRWGRRHKAEARELLEAALEMDAHEYWHDMAREMLDDL